MPEYVLDRSLGRVVAEELRTAGWSVQRLADRYPNDAADVADEQWIAECTEAGLICLAKDKSIRYRARELGALERGHIFCLANGQLRVGEMIERFVAAKPRIERAVLATPVGFWLVYEGGRIERKWPPRPTSVVGSSMGC